MVSGAKQGAEGVKDAQDPFFQRNSELVPRFHFVKCLWENIFVMHSTCQTLTTVMLPF